MKCTTNVQIESLVAVRQRGIRYNHISLQTLNNKSMALLLNPFEDLVSKGADSILCHLFLQRPTDIESLNCIHSLTRIRTWLRIIPNFLILTIPISFPMVPLGRPFGPKAVQKLGRTFPQFDGVATRF